MQAPQLQMSLTKMSIEKCDNNDIGFVESPESSCKPSQSTLPLTENRMKHLLQVQKSCGTKPCITSEADDDWILPVSRNFDDVQKKEISEDETASPSTTPPKTPIDRIVIMTAERMEKLLRAPECNRRMARISRESTPPTTPPRVAMSEQRVQKLLRAPRSNRRTMPRISPEAEQTSTTTTTTNNVVAAVVLNFDDYDFGVPMRLHVDEDAIREDYEFMFDLSDSEEEDDSF